MQIADLKSANNKVTSSYSLERFSAWATWAVVSGFSLTIMIQSNNFSTTHILVTVLLYAVYFLLWTLISRGSESKQGDLSTKNAILMFALFATIVAIYFAVPIGFVAIFMVIYSAMTPYFMSMKRAAMLSPVLALPLFLVHHFYWDIGGALMSSILFWTFNIFALIMVNTSIREREARLEAELTSRKLEATQNLLNEAVKQSERVRIARNIHDLLGHHLTALTINLQVASIKSDGEVKKSIEQCHQLAKLLLSDVREAVSDIRDKSVLDLESNITSMLDKIPNIKAEIEIDKAIQIDDIQIADAIIKTIQETITNTLKHAKGSLITIRIKNRDAQTDKLSSAEDKKQIQVDISNNGSLPNHIKQGNGLSGIQERLFALNGEAIFSINNKLFQTQLLIPVGQHD